MTGASYKLEILHQCGSVTNASHSKQADLLAKMTNETEQFIRQENEDSDVTDGAFDLLRGIAESVQEDFDKRIDVSSDKEKVFKSIGQDTHVVPKYKRR